MESTDLSAALTRRDPESADMVRISHFDAVDAATTLVEIASDELHLWRASLDLPADEIDALCRSLSPDEIVRADRFHFPRDRHRFVAARSTLRSILSRYTGTAPEQVRFDYGPQGKPALAFPTSDLRFNLSHSEEMALYAITRGRAVGVDVERVRPWPDAGSLVESYFTPRERVAFRALPAESRDDVFFQWWTRKEAYIKALGAGHSHPLDRIDVLDGLDSPDWLLWDLDTLPGFHAAVVVGVR
jgi:4'-phosphopantetheinyl transferase